MTLFFTEWSVPEYQVTVSKGLHLFGKLKLKTDEVYDATVNLLDNMQVQTVVHLRPLRYGKITQNSNGRPLYENINLFLYGSKEQSDSGPKLVVDPQTQYLKGCVVLFNFDHILSGIMFLHS